MRVPWLIPRCCTSRRRYCSSARYYKWRLELREPVVVVLERKRWASSLPWRRGLVGENRGSRQPAMARTGAGLAAYAEAFVVYWAYRRGWRSIGDTRRSVSTIYCRCSSLSQSCIECSCPPCVRCLQAVVCEPEVLDTNPRSSRINNRREWVCRETRRGEAT